MLLPEVGWPAWAGAAAGAFFFLSTGASPAAGDASTVYTLGVGDVFGMRPDSARRSAHRAHAGDSQLGARGDDPDRALVLAIMFVAPSMWLRGLAGFVGFDPGAGTFQFIPPGRRFLPVRRVRRYSRRRGSDQRHALELGARQGLRDERAQRAISRPRSAAKARAGPHGRVVRA